MVTVPFGSVNPSLLIPRIHFNSISEKWGSELHRAAEENGSRCSSVQEHPGLHPAHSACIDDLVFCLKNCSFFNFHVCFYSHWHQWAMRQSEKQTRPSHTSGWVLAHLLFFWFIHGCCWSVTCLLWTMQNFPDNRIINPYFISFQILQLYFSEVHVCLGEGV